MQQPHNSFPSLPVLDDQQYAALNREAKWRRFVAEVEAAQQQFAAMQQLGIPAEEACEMVPTPRANRASAKQADLRKLYQPATTNKRTRDHD